MSYKIYFTLFLTIITITLFSALLFIANRIQLYFGINLYVLTLLAFMFPVALILDKLVVNRFTSILYGFVWTLAGSTVIIWSVVAFVELISMALPLQIIQKGILALSLSIILVLFAIISAEKIFVTEINVPVKTKKKLTLLQITDMHLGTIHRKMFVERIVKLIKEIKPDYTFIVGDLFDGSGEVNDEMLKPFNKLKQKPYFVTGNHDNYVGVEKVISKVKKYLVVVRNEIVRTKDLQILGLDNPNKETVKRIKAFDELGQKLDGKTPSVVLLHTPTAIKSFVESKANLMLSGHTHKGQIFPLYFLVRLKHKYVYGLHKLKDKYLNVSSGCGTAGPTMRLFTKSEVVKINLVPVS